MKRHTRKSSQAQAYALLPLAGDVDLVRFETNLLQIGFFSAHDPRTSRDSTRVLEQMVTRNGQRIRVTAKFSSSEELGLPSTADRDKFLALMKIVSEERARVGFIQNPIRFSGYRLLKELGLSDAGQNYEELAKWGRRMAATSITSEKVIYLSAKKRWAEKTVHVFRSFERVGESNLDGTDRVEAYEAHLEDWVLENLNHGYVVPEDFSAYKKLTRPTSKGIFGNLHLWFHASQGQAVEKDYRDLCHYLNVKAYPHASKIKETMGLALDELMKVGYLESWSLEPRTSREGFKLRLIPGQELLRVISISQRKQLADKSAGTQIQLSAAQEAAMSQLVVAGVLPAKAKTLVQQYDADLMLDQIEYASAQIAADQRGRGRIENPAGFIIYSIENALPVPASFQTVRKFKQDQAQRSKAMEEQHREFVLQMKYSEWKNELANAELNARFNERELEEKLKEIVSIRRRMDPHFKRMSGDPLRNLALQFLRKDILEELCLPSYEDWRSEQVQGQLF